ncbi:serine/threonine-protein kinase mos-like isoform X2 [Euwallacea similis]|uniref:serine/threonine-protein kinase mos-like isoform X2 n=1 Tax=Euwallacea similis TaxID=1736056 RepID=UPI00344CC069
MASFMRNVSALLSPRAISPYKLPRNKVELPKSERKSKLFSVNRSRVAKRLEFSPLRNATTPNKPSFPNDLNIPNIKIHKINEDLGHNRTAEQSRLLAINTPTKLELSQNGLDELRDELDILGKGSFGTVFKGLCKEAVVAVKIVEAESSAGEKNALHLEHENVIKTLEIIENSPARKYNIIIMEFLPNSKNLQQLFTESKQDIDNTLLHQFATDITTGLQYLHAKGILHLDLKPKNILVVDDFRCKICDFGSSVNIRDNLKSFQNMGTLLYTAPEIFNGKSPTFKSDIYSLGLVFWQLKYQKLPYEGHTVWAVIYNVVKNGLRPTYSVTGKDKIESLFIQCWHNEPERRPTTGDILQILKNISF